MFYAPAFCWGVNERSVMFMMMEYVWTPPDDVEIAYLLTLTDRISTRKA